MACWVELPCWAAAIELITPKSQCSRCDCTKNASHEVLPVSPSRESPPDSDGSKNASTISIGSDLANLGLWSARSHRIRRAALLHPAARVPRAAKPLHRRGSFMQWRDDTTLYDCAL